MSINPHIYNSYQFAHEKLNWVKAQAPVVAAKVGPVVNELADKISRVAACCLSKIVDTAKHLANVLKNELPAFARATANKFSALPKDSQYAISSGLILSGTLLFVALSKKQQEPK